MKNRIALSAIAALGILTSCATTPRVLAPPSGPDVCTSWGDLPITVDLDRSAYDYRGEVARAMADWNNEIGRDAFVWNEDAEKPGDVLVVVGDVPAADFGDHATGLAASECENGRPSTVVTLERMDIVAVYHNAVHELGHALGLGHSTNDTSIMRQRMKASLMGKWEEQGFYRITEGDARLARALHPARGAVVSRVETEGGVIVQKDETDMGVIVNKELPKTKGDSPNLAAAAGDPWAAFSTGNYALGVVLALIMAMALLRKVAPALFSSDVAGAATTFAGSFLGALATAWSVPEATFTWGTVKAAAVVAILAMGGYSVAWKKLAKPALRWFADKVGWGWMSRALGVVLVLVFVGCDPNPAADADPIADSVTHGAAAPDAGTASGIGTSPSVYAAQARRNLELLGPVCYLEYDTVGPVHYAAWVDVSEEKARARAATGLHPDGNWFGGQGGHVTGVDAIAACASFAPRFCEVRRWDGVAP